MFKPNDIIKLNPQLNTENSIQFGKLNYINNMLHWKCKVIASFNDLQYGEMLQLEVLDKNVINNVVFIASDCLKIED
jgi:hypothetical protein